MNFTFSRRVLTILGVLAASLTGTYSVVLADCTLSGGGTATCTSTDSNGFNQASTDNLTVTVDAGATVDASLASGQGISVGDNSTITNSGSVASDYGVGVQLGDNGTVTNNGTITSSDDNALALNNDATVTNLGTITSTYADGVNAVNNGTVTNFGTITSTDADGVFLQDDASVTNYGTIDATGFGNGVTINNGTVTNYGTIDANSNSHRAGVEVDSAGTSTLENFGTITGGQAVEDLDPNSSLTVNNSGTLTATSPAGIAVDLGPGNDTFEARPNSVVNGTIDGGSGFDTFIFSLFFDSQSDADAATATLATLDPAADSGFGHTWLNFSAFVANFGAPAGSSSLNCGTNPYAPFAGPGGYERPFIAVCSSFTGDSNEVTYDGMYYGDVLALLESNS